MSEVEQQLHQALVNLETAAQQVRTANPKPNLAALFQRIDDLAGQLPPTASPELAHYLQRKSYEKARQFLEGKSRTPGACRES